MRRIDELHHEFPFAGSWMLRDLLLQEGIEIGRRLVATLMKKIAIEAIYRRSNTSKPVPGKALGKVRACLHMCLLGRQSCACIDRSFYNTTRPHSSLAAKPQDQAYFANIGSSEQQPADAPLIC